MEVYRNNLVYIEVEPAEIPWLKIFTVEEKKEFTACNKQTRQLIFHLLDIIEREMLDYYQPDKINIASFANYLPRVHWHIMARFKKDSYFPEPVWGEKQREGVLELPSIEAFIKQLSPKLEVIEKA